MYMVMSSISGYFFILITTHLSSKGKVKGFLLAQHSLISEFLSYNYQLDMSELGHGNIVHDNKVSSQHNTSERHTSR